MTDNPLMFSLRDIMPNWDATVSTSESTIPDNDERNAYPATDSGEKGLQEPNTRDTRTNYIYFFGGILIVLYLLNKVK